MRVNDPIPVLPVRPPERHLRSAAIVVGIVLVAAALVITVAYNAGAASMAPDLEAARERTERAISEADEAQTYSAMLLSERDGLRSDVASLTSDVTSLTAAVRDAERERDAVREDLDALKKAADPKPTPKASTPSVSRSSTPIRAGAEQWRGTVAKHFPASAVDEALYIIGRESGGNPSARNGSCVGLFQLDSGVHFSHYPEVDGFTADGNVYIASRLWKASGNSFDKHWYGHTSYPRYGG